LGLIISIVIGGFAGWVAEKIMKSDMGLLANIGLGMLGAFLAKIAFGLLGISFGGPTGYLVAGIVGACALIFISRGIKGRSGGDV